MGFYGTSNLQLSNLKLQSTAEAANASLWSSRKSTIVGTLLYLWAEGALAQDRQVVGCARRQAGRTVSPDTVRAAEAPCLRLTRDQPTCATTTRQSTSVEVPKNTGVQVAQQREVYYNSAGSIVHLLKHIHICRHFARSQVFQFGQLNWCCVVVILSHFASDVPIGSLMACSVSPQTKDRTCREDNIHQNLRWKQPETPIFPDQIPKSDARFEHLWPSGVAVISDTYGPWDSRDQTKFTRSLEGLEKSVVRRKNFRQRFLKRRTR